MEKKTAEAKGELIQTLTSEIETIYQMNDRISKVFLISVLNLIMSVGIIAVVMVRG